MAVTSQQTTGTTSTSSTGNEKSTSSGQETSSSNAFGVRTSKAWKGKWNCDKLENGSMPAIGGKSYPKANTWQDKKKNSGGQSCK